MANVFRVFYSKINLSTDKATKLVLAAAVLHNMLRTGHANTYTAPGFADEIDGYNVVEVSWRKVQCQHISTFTSTKIWKQFKTNGRKHKRILCWLFLRSRCGALAMENVDIIRTIGKTSFYIYAHLQIIGAAIRSCSLRQMFQNSWQILWKIPAKELF